MDGIELTPQQEAEVARIVDNLRAAALVEFPLIAQLLVSKSNGELFGETEFQVRDMLLRVAARGMDAALEERKKGGTNHGAAASSARTAKRTRNS